MICVVGAITSVWSGVSRGGLGHGWRIDGPHVFRDTAFGSSPLSLRSVRRGIPGLVVFWTNGNEIVAVLEVVKLALADLFSDDVDVAWEVDFLGRFDDKARE